MVKADPRSFRYERRTPESVKERANMRGGSFDSIIKPQFKQFKVRDGKNLIRILPPTWGPPAYPKPKHYAFDLFVNYDIGVDNQSYLSLSKMKGERDPLDEARRVAQREGDEKLAKALLPRPRLGMWIIDRNAEDDGPQLWVCPFTVDKSFLTLAIDEDTNEVLYPDTPFEEGKEPAGNDIRFYKEGQGLLTKYDPLKMKILQSSPLHEDMTVAIEWLEFAVANPIPECLQFYPYEHIAATFNGTAGSRDAEEDPFNERAKPRAGSRPVDRDGTGTEPTPRKAVASDATSNGGKRQETRAAVEDQDEDSDEVKPRGPSIRDRLAARRGPAREAETIPEEDE